MNGGVKEAVDPAMSAYKILSDQLFSIVPSEDYIICGNMY